MKISNSYYTAKNSRITGSEKIKNTVVSAVLMNSYKENRDIFQSVYTAQNRSISRKGLQYIQGWSCRFAPAPSGETVPVWAVHAQSARPSHTRTGITKFLWDIKLCLPFSFAR